MDQAGIGAARLGPVALGGALSTTENAENGPTREGASTNLVSITPNLSFIDDGLRGFEITDTDGYLLAFFRLRDR